tara:strand:+ start:2565 stop:4454 length:1890 start_codon:yes stop_codon:yes gene_type:complete
MCGLAGIIGHISDLENQNLIKMLSIQSHRGPDGHRILKTNNSLLGFSRLKIIDFSDRAMQPMVSRDNKHVLVFNGEIYNYKYLKQKIGKKYNFETLSDSEVLLAVLVIYGLEGLKFINGMFSFCYYDVDANTYTLVRDRFGQKPLFYSKFDDNYYFASEIKSLVFINQETKLNYENINNYLLQGNLDCSHSTFFLNINQIEPGHFLKIRNNKLIEYKKWYEINTNAYILPKIKNEKNDFIKNIINMVCEEHLNSDTDIGIKLSGGLDSSTMLASMEKNKKYLSNRCFSVDFGESLSEKKWIYETANFFNKEPSISTYRIEDFLNDFGKMIYTHEGPLGGLMNCAFENVYKEARENNIRVLLDGTGLDEAFGGYRIHHLVYLNRLYNDNSTSFEKNLSLYAEKWNLTKKEVKSELNKLKQNNSFVQDASTFDQNVYLSDFIHSFKNSHVHQAPDYLSSVHKHLINYIICSKIPKNTRIKDRQSMSYSIELRMPFLDHRIIELGLALNEKSYFSGGLTKSIIREVMKEKLPDPVRLGQKRSIQAPQGDWLRSKKVIGMVKDLIYSKKFKYRDIFNADEVIKTYDEFILYGAHNTFHIWQWINMEMFFQIFVDKKNITYKMLPNIEFRSLNV